MVKKVAVRETKADRDRRIASLALSNAANGVKNAVRAARQTVLNLPVLDSPPAYALERPIAAAMWRVRKAQKAVKIAQLGMTQEGQAMMKEGRGLHAKYQRVQADAGVKQQKSYPLDDGSKAHALLNTRLLTDTCIANSKTIDVVDFARALNEHKTYISAGIVNNGPANQKQRRDIPVDFVPAGRVKTVSVAFTAGDLASFDRDLENNKDYMSLICQYLQQETNEIDLTALISSILPSSAKPKANDIARTIAFSTTRENSAVVYKSTDGCYGSSPPLKTAHYTVSMCIVHGWFFQKTDDRLYRVDIKRRLAIAALETNPRRLIPLGEEMEIQISEKVDGVNKTLEQAILLTALLSKTDGADVLHFFGNNAVSVDLKHTACLSSDREAAIMELVGWMQNHLQDACSQKKTRLETAAEFFDDSVGWDKNTPEKYKLIRKTFLGRQFIRDMENGTVLDWSMSPGLGMVGLQHPNSSNIHNVFIWVRPLRESNAISPEEQRPPKPGTTPSKRMGSEFESKLPPVFDLELELMNL